ncbi:tetratricopeptide repeat protein [Arhodomonas sp. AD133]|uniref:tetratricopeptide repeat protein n=1 Tax=Arhodomonas sp. AD133 TaxID=3415009 RepID=UPI003EC0C5DE
MTGAAASLHRLAGALALGLVMAMPPVSGAGIDDARKALDAGDPGKAVRLARAVTETEPEQAAAWRILARGLIATGEYQQAAEVYERVARLAPQPDLPAQVALARLDTLLGRSERARQRLEGVADVARRRERALTPAADIAVGDAYRRLARSDPALYHAALDHYERAIRRAPDDPRGHVALGELLLDRYNNTEALQAFRTALERDDGYLPALLGLARSQRFDHSPAAERTVALVLDRRPGYVPARLLLARLLLDGGRVEAAERHIHRALAVNPHSPEARALLAAVHYLRDDHERFGEQIAAIHGATPGYGGVFETLAEIAGQNRRYRDALRFARTQIGQDSQAWRGHMLAGENLLRLGDMSAGRASLDRAFRGDPYDVRTKNTLDLLDRLADFETVRSERFTLVAAPGEAEVLALRLLPIAEQAYEFFEKRYGVRPQTPIRIELYPRHEDFSVRTVGLVGVNILGVCFGPVIALNSPSSGTFGPFNWASAVWHEIAHSFHLAATGGRMPRWFSEGLAVYEERAAHPGWGMDVTPDFLHAFHSGRLPPASDMDRAFLRPSYPRQIAHAYYQASLVVAFIEQRHGFDAVVAMIEGFAEGATTAELIAKRFAMKPAAFDRAFETYVHERFRHSLRGLFPDGRGAGADYAAVLARGRAALEQEAFAEAREPLRQALAMFPDHAGPGSAYRLLADAEIGLGNRATAMDLLERSIAIDADDLDAHRTLVRLYRETGAADAAARTLERATLIQPFDPATYRDMAAMFERRGAWQAAIPARQAVVALGPVDEAGARYRLARALSHADRTEAARTEVLRALEIAPLYDDALELLLTVRDRRLTAERPDAAPGAEPRRPERNGPARDAPERRGL